VDLIGVIQQVWSYQIDDLLVKEKKVSSFISQVSIWGLQCHIAMASGWESGVRAPAGGHLKATFDSGLPKK